MHIEPDAMQREIIRKTSACFRAGCGQFCVHFVVHSSLCLLSFEAGATGFYCSDVFLFLSFFIFPLNLMLSFSQAILKYLLVFFFFKGMGCRRRVGMFVVKLDEIGGSLQSECWLLGGPKVHNFQLSK